MEKRGKEIRLTAQLEFNDKLELHRIYPSAKTDAEYAQFVEAICKLGLPSRPVNEALTMFITHLDGNELCRSTLERVQDLLTPEVREEIERQL
jgi:hypothetical protein